MTHTNSPEEQHLTTQTPPEEVVWTGAPSQWVNVQVFFFSLVVLCAIVAVVVITSNKWILLLALYPLFRSAFEWYKTKNNSYKVTNQRLVISAGGLGHHTVEVDLNKVGEVVLIEPWYNKMLGIGTVELTLQQSADREAKLIAVSKAGEVSELIRKAVAESKADKAPEADKALEPLSQTEDTCIPKGTETLNNN